MARFVEIFERNYVILEYIIMRQTVCFPKIVNTIKNAESTLRHGNNSYLFINFINLVYNTTVVFYLKKLIAKKGSVTNEWRSQWSARLNQEVLLRINNLQLPTAFYAYLQPGLD